MENRQTCEKCKGKGFVKEADGSIHTCWECMAEGRLNQHSDNLPDSKIRL